MAAIPFILLFCVGLLLSIIFGITTIVLAFQESVVWGLLAWLVPFAALVFTIKFWSRKWVRRSFLYTIGGALMMIVSSIGASLTMPALLQQIAGARLEQEGISLEGAWEEGGFGEAAGTPALPASVSSEVPFYDGVNYATAAAELTQTAQSPAEWAEVAENWEMAIALMAEVPTDHPKFDVAQAKVSEYQNNWAYANQNAQR